MILVPFLDVCEIGIEAILLEWVEVIPIERRWRD